MFSMNTSEDKIGDLLRHFYAEYGVPAEGPPPGIPVSRLLGDLPVPDADLDILREALNDETARRQFRDCRAVLDDLANRLTGEELLAELLAVPLPSEQGMQQLSSGVFWFALASSLDWRKDGVPLLPFHAGIDLPLPLMVQMTVHASLVLRLYVALVYMREGVLNDLIAESARAGRSLLRAG
jgi:hypothetical protein